MTVSVVIVNWNAGEALVRAVASVRQHAGGVELVVVDNGSDDGSLAAARARHAELVVVETGTNLGFASGANRGAAVATGEVLVFLNPDAELLPGALTGLTEALVRWPDAGIAGGGLCDPDGRWQPGAAYFGPLRHLVCDSTVGRLWVRRHAPSRVDWVYGTFMAVRRDLFVRLGGFDQRYFLYGEDMDLCDRARALGALTVHVPAARALHARNVSARQRFGDGRDAEVMKGEMRFYAWRRGRGALRLFRCGALLKLSVKAVLASLAGRARVAAVSRQVVRTCWSFQP